MDEIEQLKLENARLLRELEKSREKSRKYLQNVAHQLTAPLGAIKWSIEALKDESVPFKRKMNIYHSIYSQATILVHLIKNFSLMSNLEVGHELGEFKKDLESIDLHRLTVNLANDFQPQAYREDERKKILVIDDTFRKILGNKQVSMVKNLIAQAISNLLENAVKYADEETEIIINAEKVKDGVGISIVSIGVPIQKAEIDKIFERDYRGNLARQKVAPGTGIGLYLATKIIQVHDGRIDLEIDGRKSKFTLIFPNKLILSI
jgi:two-component system phosphate regulon sensor histidine kinase PhoR